MSELKRCPFCGGEAEFVGMFDEWDGRLYSVSCVRCKNCHVEVNVSELDNADRCKRKRMVINKWNSRKPVEDVLERLEAEKDSEIIFLPGRASGKTLQAGQRIGIDKAIRIIKEGLESCE